MDLSVGSDQLSIVGTVALAMAAGALIGFERELADKPAGLRTHMLVAASAALLVSLGDVLVMRFDRELDGVRLQTDPVRIIEAIVTGVSFLGAGTIIRHRGERVEGLTTAASVLISAVVGVTVALGQLLAAGGVTLLVLITLRAPAWFSRQP